MREPVGRVATWDLQQSLPGRAVGRQGSPEGIIYVGVLTVRCVENTLLSTDAFQQLARLMPDPSARWIDVLLLSGNDDGC